MCVQAEALQLLRQHLSSTPFTLVLLDNVMPGMSGLEVARAIRQDPQLCSLSVVGVTGNALPLDINEFLDAGADQVNARARARACVACVCMCVCGCVGVGVCVVVIAYVCIWRSSV